LETSTAQAAAPAPGSITTCTGREGAGACTLHAVPTIGLIAVLAELLVHGEHVDGGCEDGFQLLIADNVALVLGVLSVDGQAQTHKDGLREACLEEQNRHPPMAVTKQMPPFLSMLLHIHSWQGRPTYSNRIPG